jgi:beta-galactosidase
LLDACDRLGMLVIDENRLMGTTDFHYDHLRRMILRDRNHPERHPVVRRQRGMAHRRQRARHAPHGDHAGVRETTRCHAARHRRHQRRLGLGNSVSIEAAGLNYLGNMNKGGFTTDQWHAKRPEQPHRRHRGMRVQPDRGIYFDDRKKCHLRAYDWDPSDWGASAEQAWSHYADRHYLAGMFVWTGFDYRGEPTPFGWPAIASQFGILDLCGFPKDARTIFKPGGATSRCCTFSRTGTGRARKARRSASGRTAIATKWNFSSTAKASGARP